MSAVEVDDTALLGALVAFRRLEPETRKAVQRATRQTLTPAWRNMLASSAARPQGRGYPKQDRKMIGKGRVSASVSGKGTLVAWTGKSLSGGYATWPGLEFGSLKHSGLPHRVSSGRIAYPAVKKWGPAAARVWLAVISDTLRAIPGAEDA